MPDWLKIVTLPWVMLWTLVGGLWQLTVLGFIAGQEMVLTEADAAAERNRRRRE